MAMELCKPSECSLMTGWGQPEKSGSVHHYGRCTFNNRHARGVLATRRLTMTGPDRVFRDYRLRQNPTSLDHFCSNSLRPAKLGKGANDRQCPKMVPANWH